MSLMNTQYDSIMRMYAARQARSRQEYEERMEQIQRDVPELSALEADITACQAALVRSAIEENPAGQTSLKSRLKALQAQRTDLLSAHGLTPESLKPVYVCPDCRDTGYIGTEKCHCFLQAEINLLYHQSNLNEILKQENFDTFSYNWYDGDDRESMRRTVAEARLFIEQFDTQFQNLLLLGAVGTGKTFLSNCIAKELMDRCHSVVYLTAFQLFDLLSKAAFGADRNASDYSQTYPYLFDCDLLIIDDLGTELPNSFTVSQFFLCINERILRKKSTLISSNLDMEALRSVYSERTLSRIISSYTIRQLPGSDIRIKKKLYNTNL
ncbi:ATP-binding protein [Candidatus Merdisoma sp. HCP28S3_D10]|uniref:ATP-binding protein n=1 Tax=unclassified Candidatus Merdisoma TaxID=3099611 RepID=UPI003F8BC5D8